MTATHKVCKPTQNNTVLGSTLADPALEQMRATRNKNINSAVQKIIITESKGLVGHSLTPLTLVSALHCVDTETQYSTNIMGGSKEEQMLDMEGLYD